MMDQKNECDEEVQEAFTEMQRQHQLSRNESAPTLSAPFASRSLRNETGDDPNYFPTKLHRMLMEIDSDFNHLRKFICWQLHGRCFIIRDEPGFIQEVMPR